MGLFTGLIAVLLILCGLTGLIVLLLILCELWLIVMLLRSPPPILTKNTHHPVLTTNLTKNTYHPVLTPNLLKHSTFSTFYSLLSLSTGRP
jgi:hypothetical protein